MKVKSKNNKKCILSLLANSSKLDYKTLDYFLWHSPTTQCYIHRDKKYDNTFALSGKSDLYCALELYKNLKLDELKIFKKASECQCEINKIKNLNNKNILYIVKSDNNSLDGIIKILIEKLRNSIAHGTFYVKKMS